MELSPVRAAEFLISQLEAAGLDPLTLNPWETWKVFKAFARIPVDSPDEGISVQAGRETEFDGAPTVVLTLMRQFVSPGDDETRPFRWVGVELNYAPEAVPGLDGFERWSYDYPDLAAFATAVEAEPEFQAAMNAAVLYSEVVSHEV